MRVRGLIAAVALGTGLSLTAPMLPVAQADSPGCVKKPEFRKAKRGMTTERIKRIFDTNGSQTFQGFGYQQREYATCGSQYGFVFIDFNRRAGKWKMSGKTAYWG